MVACTASAALAVSGCANMGAGGYLGALAGGAGGAALGDSMDSGDGLMTLLWAVAGMSLGAAMGNGALTPGELARGMYDAEAQRQAEEQQRRMEYYANLPPAEASSDTSDGNSTLVVETADEPAPQPEPDPEPVTTPAPQPTPTGPYLDCWGKRTGNPADNRPNATVCPM